MDTSAIPEGIYCYTIDEVQYDSYRGRLKIKCCPYWKYKEKFGIEGAYCKFLERPSIYGDPFNLIWDQVKECGINEGELYDY